MEEKTVYFLKIKKNLVNSCFILNFYNERLSYKAQKDSCVV